MIKLTDAEVLQAQQDPTVLLAVANMHDVHIRTAAMEGNSKAQYFHMERKFVVLQEARNLINKYRGIPR